jgi:hypothetical protein
MTNPTPDTDPLVGLTPEQSRKLFDVAKARCSRWGALTESHQHVTLVDILATLRAADHPLFPAPPKSAYCDRVALELVPDGAFQRLSIANGSRGFYNFADPTDAKPGVRRVIAAAIKDAQEWTRAKCVARVGEMPPEFVAAFYALENLDLAAD